jgi:hypothetical protein
MRINSKALLDLVSIVGAVALFGAWAFQQTLLSDANGRLQGVSSAEQHFETYQSHNALFNALVAMAPANAQPDIRRFQVVNYEMALSHLETPLSPQEQAGLPPAPRPYDGNWNFATAMPQMQKRIEAVQTTLQKRKQEVAESSAAANRIFLVWYGLGSLLILAVSIGRIFLPAPK